MRGDRRVLALALVLGALFLAVGVYRVLLAFGAEETGSALAARLRRAPDPRVRAERRASAGRATYALFVPSREILASGPGAYVVDERGAILAFCDDVGDTPSFVNQWLAGPGEPVPATDVLTLLESGETSGSGASIMPGESPPIHPR